MKDYFRLIAFSHTIFALPFAMVGYIYGLYSGGIAFDIKLLTLVVLCMVFARSAAMGFNRFLDTDIDIKNHRTVTREIPSGKISKSKALSFVFFNSAAFIITTYFINNLCFFLSPVALFVILGYSYTKRFTVLCHLILGVGLALAPIGAFLAVNPSFNWVPIFFGLAVLFWVSGFDIIYALQDEDFDRNHLLHSIPVRFGRKRSLNISKIFHLICAGLLSYATYKTATQFSLNLPYVGLSVFLGMLVYQHTLVKENDLSRVDRAFFTTNGFASIIYGVFYILAFVSL